MVSTWFLSLIHVLADTQTRQISPKNQKVFSQYIQFCCIRLFANTTTYQSAQQLVFYQRFTATSLGCLSNYSILSANSPCKKALLLSSQLASWLLTGLNNFISVKCILSYSFFFTKQKEKLLPFSCIRCQSIHFPSILILFQNEDCLLLIHSTKPVINNTSVPIT